ncbi:IS66 family insertion sequence element accessory protein TnpA [Massilia alkalitolerans]|jgi:hypothetical protein|uniref:IS66 family insertion sequence element accessory protein TnpA n=1 Tax=Massilia alkalitolerans TaxID=286638 RepID=UPI0004060BC4|nr:hypothetical protein [Massilia alkalitolerans]
MTRHRIPASIWHERVAQWRSSGLTAEAYASEHDIGLERLMYWARRVKRASGGGQLLPVRVAVPAAASPLELRSPSGWSMRMDAGVDSVWLARLLQELR